ncbi:MAG: tRNA (N(6)-L-threonylcarbamoyladenosine(37)-C(2))-methylthiotransferase MtaB [Bacteroidales bacterium]|nr:tRNA (N(6)-L-threonylcarbamoyladenosine(37)-C(2))-methylthiotransferase MtaB [Bacteroidales bacterium]
MAKKIGFYTLGCKMNYAETDAIARKMGNAGYEHVKFTDFADYYVVNSCSVTESANKKTRQAIRAAHRRNPSARIIVMGCYAQLKPKEVGALEGVCLVLGVKEKFNILEQIEMLEEEMTSLQVTNIEEVSDFDGAYSCSERTRAFLKVQDGCNYRCSYCTIPLARGKSRNTEIQLLVKQAEEIAARGVKEIVLSGINIGDFGQTTGEKFIDLLKALDQVKGIERYRISSIEPNLITSEVIDFVVKSRAFMPHFHIPLQCGSDDVLRLMRRRYNTEFFRKKIEEIHTKIPDAFIGMDVMVGFMGETDQFFKNSYDFIESLNVSFVHVFTYSERENTDALNIKPRIQESVRTERSVELHNLSENLHKNFYKKFDGQVRKVLFETRSKDGFYVGYTDNYIRVQAKLPFNVKNKIVAIKLHYNDGVMFGELVE